MRCFHFLRTGRRIVGAAATLLLLVIAADPARGVNLLIGFDNGPVITDGSGLDLDGTVNDQIVFGGTFGTAGYWVSGTLQQSPTWPVGQSLSGYLPPITGGLTLTKFVAEAVAGSAVGTPLTIRYKADFPGVFGSGTAVATLDAEVGNSAALAVPPGGDRIMFYQASVFDSTSLAVIVPSTGGTIPLANPLHPGPGTTPYPVTGLGPAFVPAMTNPTIDSSFQIILGGTNDQFILPSSAEVGFTSQLVPEPGFAALAVLGFIGSGAARSWRRRAGR